MMSRPRRFLLRLINFVRPDRAEQELDRELSSHLTLLEDEHRRRGLAPDAARLAAQRALGGVMSAKELHRDARSFRWLDDARLDLRYAVRTLRRTPGFSAVAIITLALGIGANTAVFGALCAVLYPQVAYSNAGRLVKIEGVTRDGAVQGRISAPRFRAVRHAATTFEAVAAADYVTDPVFHLTGDGREPERLVGLRVTTSFFPLIAVSPIVGRGFTPNEVSDRDRVVMISQELWRDRFDSSSSIVGRFITLNGGPYQVIGVVASDPWLRRPNLKVYAAIDPGEGPGTGDTLYVYARLRPGATAGQAEAAVTTSAREIPPLPPDESDWRSRVVPLRETVFPDREESLSRFQVLQGAVSTVFLIACANFANLLLVRGAGRRRELALRRALGATASRVLRQLLMEGFVLGMIAGGLGVLLSVWTASVVTAIWAVDASILRDQRVLTFGVGTGLLAAVVVSFVSAWAVIGRGRNEGLNDGERIAGASRRTATLQHALVVGEIGLTLTALVCAGLLIGSVARQASADPGFDTSRLLLARTHFTGERYRNAFARGQFIDQALDRISQQPGVVAAAVADWYPPVTASMSTVAAPDAPGAGAGGVRARHRRVTAGYVRAVGVPIVLGRDFTSADLTARPSVAIVNEVLAESFWPGQNPVGRTMTLGRDRSQRLTVVGVVRSADDNEVYRERPRPEVLELSAVPSQSPWFVIRTAADPSLLTPVVRRAVFQVDPDQPLAAIRTLDGWLATERSGPRAVMRLLVSLAILAVALTIIGIHGTLAHLVAQRAREIGIRMALGATRSDVLGLVVRRSATLTFAGLALGLAGAAAITRYLEGLLFGVAPLDATTFIAAPVMFVVIATLASYVPARRAMKVDPLTALRCT